MHFQLGCKHTPACIIHQRETYKKLQLLKREGKIDGHAYK